MVALLTPPSRGAIATLAVAGPEAWRSACELFVPRTNAAMEPVAGRFWLGRMGTVGRGFDDVVLAVKRIDPVPHVEIHSHGGPQVVRLLIALLAELGVRECSWQDMTPRTAGDFLQGEATIALAQAATWRTATILLDQHLGAFRTAIERIISDLQAAGPALARLSELAPLGRHLVEPWRVVVAGAPNVGKSSLVNALAGFQRSIVSPIPGATRDLVTTRIAIDGWPIELVDTAGWRSEADPLEQEGIVRAKIAAGEADLCLWVADATAPVLPADPAFRLVVNKMDLEPNWSGEGTLISAQTGSGLDELCRRISAWLVPAPPRPGEALPFTPELCDTIEAAAANPTDAIRRLTQLLQRGVS